MTWKAMTMGKNNLKELKVDNLYKKTWKEAAKVMSRKKTLTLGKAEILDIYLLIT